MRYLFLIVAALVLLTPACIPQSLVVNPVSPVSGSTVTSLSPVLTWAGSVAGAQYRLQVAADANFQNMVIDQPGINDVVYNVPSSRLSSNASYYWRVMGLKGDRVSVWTSPWWFRTTGGAASGSVQVTATLDGAPWSGTVNFRLSGPFSDSENTLPWSFNSVTPGSYSLTYNYGGPANASLEGISPSPAQELAGGGAVTFNLNFHSKSSTSINVSAMIDGSPWSGSVTYTISGPFRDIDNYVPHSFMSEPAGTYTVTYNSGGPAGAIFTGITPSPVQVLSRGGSVDYTLNFTSSRSAALSVTAFVNGAAWSGPANFSLAGPVSGSYSAVPLQLANVPAGTYTISYNSGGPAGSTLGSITPGSSLNISSGRPGGFALNYYSLPQGGNVVVNATLDGSSWAGALHFAVSGPVQSSDYQVPRTYNSVPAGSYTVSYLGGGPSGAALSSITPAPSQSLAAGRTISFNMNFTSQSSTGTILVSATIDGKPWQSAPGSGPIEYALTASELADTEYAVPVRLADMPAKTYTLMYESGGPIGATLTSITPSPTLTLRPGGTISYSLNFSGQARGYVTVEAELDGEPWSGGASYTVSGPYVESGSSVTRTFSNAPQGTYSVNYRSGGPAQARFEGVYPSSEELRPGGSVTFTLRFRSVMPGPVPRPPNPEPMPGPIPRPHPGPMPGPVPNPTPEPMPGPVPNPTPVPMPGPLHPDEPVEE